jgi:hypothetical protein
MIKLRFSPPAYKTYHGGRITTCLYECEQVDTERKKVLTKFTVQGKATCSSLDIPNEKIGRMVAESRAKFLAYKKVAMDKDCIKMCEEELDRMSDYLMYQYKVHKCKKRELEHLKKLTK